VHANERGHEKKVHDLLRSSSKEPKSHFRRQNKFQLHISYTVPDIKMGNITTMLLFSVSGNEFAYVITRELIANPTTHSHKVLETSIWMVMIYFENRESKQA
jgi:hypothetical protein